MPFTDRERAAADLVALASGAGARDTIAALLDDSPNPPTEKTEQPAGASVMLRAIARTPEAPPELLPVLAALAAKADPRALAEVLPAFGSIRTVDSARALLAIATAARTEPVRAGAFSALYRLTGRDDFGRDTAGWKAYLDEAAGWAETRWRDELARNLAARADRLADARRTTAATLTEALRKLHLATAPEERSTLLVSMLTDPVPEVRAVAFELVSRELSAARRLDPVVGETMLSLLRDPSPQVRENAAVLVKQIAPAGVLAAVMGALRAETDPSAAAAMLQAAARSPIPDLLEPALRWLESGTVAVGAATDAAWSLSRAGMLNDAASRSRVLAALRAMPVRELTGPGCQLVASLGDDSDRRSLAVLLESDAPALKVATADALVLYPEFLDNILAAAATEPQLLDTAARGVMMERPTAAGFRAIARLPASTDDSRRRSLLSIAAGMPGPELLEVARSYSNDLPFRESLLAVLASPERILSERADPEKYKAIGEGLILLAETRLALDRPDSAVAALDTLATLDPALDGVRTASLRAMAMLCLNRIEDAQLLNAPASVWLDALDRCMDRPYAAAIAAALSRRFAGALSPEETLRLDGLVAMLPEEPEVDTEAEFIGPPAPDRRQ